MIFNFLELLYKVKRYICKIFSHFSTSLLIRRILFQVVPVSPAWYQEASRRDPGTNLNSTILRREMSLPSSVRRRSWIVMSSIRATVWWVIFSCYICHASVVSPLQRLLSDKSPREFSLWNWWRTPISLNFPAFIRYLPFKSVKTIVTIL